MRTALIAVLAVLALSACVGQLDPEKAAGQLAEQATKRLALQAAADKYLPVPENLRGARMCWIAAAVEELDATKARYVDAQRTPATIGRIARLRAALDRLRQSDPLLHDMEIAQVLVTFGSGLYELGEGKVADYITRFAGGVTAGAVLGTAAEIAIDGVVLPYAFQTVVKVLNATKAGRITEDQAFQLCDDRLAYDQAIMSGTPISNRAVAAGSGAHPGGGQL